MHWPEPTLEDHVLQDYRVAEQSFELHVPQGCRLTPGCGLLVWIANSDSGHLPFRWKRAVEDAGLLWVGANASGDERPLAVRVNLALDAVENLRRLAVVDERRIYVAGFAGGGRVASVAALLYPDAFRGGLFLLGAEFFETIPASEPGVRVWVAAFPPPPERLRRRAAEQGRYVLVAGEKASGRAEMADLVNGFRAEGFRHVTLLEVPGLGFEMPSGTTLRRALGLLDR